MSAQERTRKAEGVIALFANGGIEVIEQRTRCLDIGIRSSLALPLA